MNDVDKQYFNLVTDIMKNGDYKQTRSGEVASVFGRMLRFNLKDGLPMLTTKKMFSRGCIHELLWFLKGATNIKYLVENNVHIWDDDAYRYYKTLVKKHNEIVDKKNASMLFHYENMEVISKDQFLENVLNEKSIRIFTEKHADLTVKYIFGDLGDVYGKQWRSFGVSKKDQIKDIIETLKTNPDDRRMLCMAFNPDVVDDVALPPCHVMFQFRTKEMTLYERLEWLWEHSNNEYDEWKSPRHDTLDELGVPRRELSLLWTQRSVDTILGLPFNILSYSILTHLIAQVVGMAVGEVICSLGDTHIYVEHMRDTEEMLHRNPLKYNLPKLVLNEEITDIDDFTIDDINIENYESYPKMNFKLLVGDEE